MFRTSKFSLLKNFDVGRNACHFVKHVSSLKIVIDNKNKIKKDNPPKENIVEGKNTIDAVVLQVNIVTNVNK